jgi:hypothetical protein
MVPAGTLQAREVSAPRKKNGALWAPFVDQPWLRR